jgi:hypothetical protein
MGLAQREVDVLKQRASDGMEAKMRAGGWSQKAPEGYVNKERLVKSGKYERWVEIDPIRGRGLRLAWDMLLTNRYTLDQICEELNSRGYTRSQGRPWAWTVVKTNQRVTAKNRLQEIFHNPFYVGWSVSEKFGIPYGEVRGVWKPIVATPEFEKGIEILNDHGDNRSREKRQHYALRGLLWVEVDGKQYKMFGSTPSGRSKSYAYYITHEKINGQKLHLSCEPIDVQIPGWLRHISIDIERLPAIRNLYISQVSKVNAHDRAKGKADLERKIIQLREEEVKLGRLFMTGMISEASLKQLRSEWQEKVKHAEANLNALENDLASYLNDLDVALVLLTKIADLYPRLDPKKRTTLLQIIVKRVIVNHQGELLDIELHSPFVYLRYLAEELFSHGQVAAGSEQVRQGS